MNRHSSSGNSGSNNGGGGVGKDKITFQYEIEGDSEDSVDEDGDGDKYSHFIDISGRDGKISAHDILEYLNDSQLHKDKGGLVYAYK